MKGAARRPLPKLILFPDRCNQHLSKFSTKGVVAITTATATIASSGDGHDHPASPASVSPYTPVRTIPHFCRSWREIVSL